MGDGERLDISRLFVVASARLARQVDLPARLEIAMGGTAATIYTAGCPHVPHEAVLEATAAVRLGGADGVLSIGGGSQTNLDTVVRRH